MPKDKINKADKIESIVLNSFRKELEQSFHRLLGLRAIQSAVANGKDDYQIESDHTTKKEVDKELKRLSHNLNSSILNATLQMYQLGNAEISKFITKNLGNISKDKARTTALSETAKAFITRKDRDGLTLSNRIWVVSHHGQKSSGILSNVVKEFETILQNGIKEGKSVQEISKDIRPYLQEPNRLFRRVRNKQTGNLELSKSALSYRPGRGVYRSSYKNAMRLVRTEMHRAYSEAKLSAIREDKHVKGYRIKLSNNHTTLKNGKPSPFHCICDDLQGEYPKTFQFHGWHPQCRCVIVPILVSFEELQAQRKGKKIEEIKDVPPQFTKWVEDNRDKIANPRLKNPLFLENNRKFWEKKNKPTALEVAKQRHENRTQEQREAIQKRWDERAKKNSPFLEQIKKLKELENLGKIEYKKVGLLKKPLSETEIINRLAGGDETEGSCASLSFAYAGNKAGLDVIDFRGGHSCDYFSNGITFRNIITKGGGVVVEDLNGFKSVNKALALIEDGKEYILGAGKHAAIVRKNGKGYEYLEMQSSISERNTWHRLNTDVLKRRFGCKKSSTSYGHKFQIRTEIVELSKIGKSQGFRDILGYLNTNTDKQMKGKNGREK